MLWYESSSPLRTFQSLVILLKSLYHLSQFAELSIIFESLIKVRVSAVITNAPYLLNVDCDHYINNSKALREAMCFTMDPISGKKICYVQFPQRFDGIDRHDRYSNRNVVFFDVSKHINRPHQYHNVLPFLFLGKKEIIHIY